MKEKCISFDTVLELLKNSPSSGKDEEILGHMWQEQRVVPAEDSVLPLLSDNQSSDVPNHFTTVCSSKYTPI